MAFLAGLLVTSQGLASGQNKSDMASGMMGQTQKAGMANVSLNNSQIRELQKILNDKGYSVGAVDGIIGPKTQQGLRDFQESVKLTATGIPDQQTLQVLAPDAKTQEFFGLSPAFGEKGMEKQQPEKQMQTPEDSKSMKKY
jgi:peptidoglycan hydrolase-like protein with peptidoglycan-binding domain